MSRFLYRNFELLEPYDAKVSCTVLRGESSRKGADLLDKQYYDKLESVHSLIKDARKVKETVELVSEISQIYSTNFNKMLSDRNFSVNELEAISNGYAKLLNESGNLLADIKNVVSLSNGLSMTDAERMSIIDDIHAKMLEHRNLVRYFSKKSISVSFIRSQEKGDMERVKSLYGNPTDRYW